MKIGLSLSRCIKDIVEGHVDPEDVLVLVTGTEFDPTLDDQWDNIWYGYAIENPRWGNAVWSELRHREDEVRAATLQLWHDGKIHQPRKFGNRPRSASYHWREVVLMDKELDLNPAAKNAWEKFKMIAELTNIKVESK
jgi:hypothetical protein